MIIYSNIHRLSIVLTLVALILITSACGQATPELVSTLAPTGAPTNPPEVTSSPEPTETPDIITEATSTLVPTATLEPEFNVLLIGTSLIYSNNGLEHHLTKLADSANPPLVLQADSVTMAGAPLEMMWKLTDAREMISEGGYDVVVLQDAIPRADVDTFHEYTRKFVAEIREVGAEPMLFMTWARQGHTLEEIAQAHADISSELDVVVAPVGIAWQRAMEVRPEIDLYVSDKIHPSIHGSYLTVNVIYATVFGENPVDLAYFPAGRQGLTKEEATFLQSVAWETVQEYQMQQ